MSWMRTPTWCRSQMGSGSYPAPPMSSCTKSQVRPSQPCRGRALAQGLGSQILQKGWVGAAPGWVHLGWGSLSCWLLFFNPLSAEASQEIFKIASMAPGALLLEAQKEYEVWHPVLLHTCLLPWAAPMQTQHYMQCDGKGVAWRSLRGHDAAVQAVQAAPAVPGLPGLQAPVAHPGCGVPHPTAHLEAVLLCRRRAKRQMST